METSWYDSIMKYAELPEEAFFEKIAIFSGPFFQPLLDEFEHSYAKNVVLYIVMGYSRDSKEVLVPSNWSTQKKLLFDKADLPDSMYSDVVELKSDAVKRVISNYLDVQEDFDYKHLKMKEDLYDYHMNKLYQNINSDATDDVKDRPKMLDNLFEEINELRASFREKFSVNNENREDIGVPKNKKRDLNIATSREVKA